MLVSLYFLHHRHIAWSLYYSLYTTYNTALPEYNTTFYVLLTPTFVALFEVYILITSKVASGSGTDLWLWALIVDLIVLPQRESRLLAPIPALFY